MPTTPDLAMSSPRDMTPEYRAQWLRNFEQHYRLNHLELAKISGYHIEHVRAWFCAEGTRRHRPVPARVIERLQLEIRVGNIRQGSK